jgi:aromatic-amino-acid transaminase
MSSLFAAVEMAPRDPILGLNEAFNADTNPNKVNLGVGVYFGDDGKIPLLGAVKAAEEGPPGNPAAARLPAHRRHPRLQQRGAGPAVRQGFRTARRRPRHHLRMPGRHRRAQGRRRLPEAPAARGQGLYQRSELGEPPRPVRVGRLHGRELPYYDAATRGVEFRRHEGCAGGHAGQVVVVLHACCHNPTGADLSAAQWAEVVDLVKHATSSPSSTWPTRALPTASSPTPSRSTCSPPPACSSWFPAASRKSFLAVWRACRRADHRHRRQGRIGRVLSQVKRVIRTNYSNPPTHGGAVVAAVLASPRTAQHVGRRTGRHARPHPRDAHQPGRQAHRRRRAPASTSSRCSAACSATPASPLPRSSA